MVNTHHNKIGFHARSLEELERVTLIPGVDLVELKPEKFNYKYHTPLYVFHNDKFTVDEKLLEGISELCRRRDITIQVHLPFEEKVDPSDELGWCQAIPEHHDLILARYELFAELLDKYGIGTVLTTHPPAFMVGGKVICSEQEALDIGKELYAKLDKMMKDFSYNFKVGIENVVAPKQGGTCYVGYKPEHIDFLIGETSEIGITYDTGHRILNDEMSAAELFRYAEIVNMHLHSNLGIVSEQGYKDDRHLLATRENLPHYKRHLKGIRRRGVPVVLEIADIDKISDEDLAAYVLNLRRDIEEKNQSE